MSPRRRVQLGREPVVHPEPLPAGVLYLIWLRCTSGSPGEEEAGKRCGGEKRERKNTLLRPQPPEERRRNANALVFGWNFTEKEGRA